MKTSIRKISRCAFVLLAVLAASARAEDGVGDDIDIYRIGTYYGEDSSYALQLDFDWAVAAATRLSVGGAYVHATGDVDTIDSYQGNVEVDHRIGHWGFALEGNYRDDDAVITTLGARGRGYYRTEQLNAGLRLGRRRIEVSYDLPAFLRQFVDDTQSTYSTEYGVDLRYAFGKFAIYTSGTEYDYDEPLNSLAARLDPTRVPSDRFPQLQERLANARARLGDVNFATLRLANNLLDYSVIVGADYRVGEHLFNAEVSRERLAIDPVAIDSVDLGWIIPIAQAADMEVRIGSAKVQDADALLYGSLNFTFYR